MSQNSLTPWQGVQVPKPTPELTKSLSPQQLAEHRRKIAFDVRVVLSAYFQPHEDEKVKAGQLAWWCDALEDWPHESVVYALRKWNEDNPRVRPTPGDIVSMMKRLRGEREAERNRTSTAARMQQVSADRSVITEEERARRKAFAESVLKGVRPMSKEDDQ